MQTPELSWFFSVMLRQRRKARGHTQAKAAYLTGVSQSTWSRIERGLTKPDLDVLGCLAGYFDVDLPGLCELAIDMVQVWQRLAGDLGPPGRVNPATTTELVELAVRLSQPEVD